MNISIINIHAHQCTCDQRDQALPVGVVAALIGSIIWIGNMLPNRNQGRSSVNLRMGIAQVSQSVVAPTSTSHQGAAVETSITKSETPTSA
jgi:hypothetical protein